MPDKVWTILEILEWSTGFFKERSIDSPRLDAELLLALALNLSRVQLYTQFDRPLVPEELARYRELVIRRARDRVPVAYIRNQREFWSLPLTVSPAVLIPRPDTERLVELVVETLRQQEPHGEHWRLVDVGTGSGAIALALASEFPEAQIYATDISQDALEVARQNASDLELSVVFKHGSLLDPVSDETRFDLVVSNPPYVTRTEMEDLAPELEHEPEMALLDAAEDGLGTVRGLAKQARKLLHPGGFLATEIGHRQGEDALAAVAAAGFEDVRLYQDYAGRDRVVIGRQPTDAKD